MALVSSLTIASPNPVLSFEVVDSEVYNLSNRNGISVSGIVAPSFVISTHRTRSGKRYKIGLALCESRYHTYNDYRPKDLREKKNLKSQ